MCVCVCAECVYPFVPGFPGLSASLTSLSWVHNRPLWDQAREQPLLVVLSSPSRQASAPRRYVRLCMSIPGDSCETHPTSASPSSSSPGSPWGYRGTAQCQAADHISILGASPWDRAAIDVIVDVPSVPTTRTASGHSQAQRSRSVQENPPSSVRPPTAHSCL